MKIMQRFPNTLETKMTKEEAIKEVANILSKAQEYINQAEKLAKENGLSFKYTFSSDVNTEEEKSWESSDCYDEDDEDDEWNSSSC
jgi:hypothetical protein